MTQSRRCVGSEGGFALLIVLWTLVLASLVFAMLAAAARSDAQLTANLRSAAELEALADGAIHTAVFEAMQGGGAIRNSQPPVRAGGVAVQVDISSQSGLVNPNVASPELLHALMVRLGADPRQANRLAGAIADWRTPGRSALPNGAKAPQYRAAGLEYGPPGAPFESLGELRDVLGMTPALLDALMPHLTLFWDGEPDPAFAGPVVRAALRDIGVDQPFGQSNAQVISIIAAAGHPGGARAARRAIIRIGPSANQRGWRVLAWDTWPG